MVRGETAPSTSEGEVFFPHLEVETTESIKVVVTRGSFRDICRKAYVYRKADLSTGRRGLRMSITTM